jgi:hypothetical protein
MGCPGLANHLTFRTLVTARRTDERLTQELGPCCLSRHDFKAGRIKCERLGRNLLMDPAEVRRIIREGLEIA